MKLTFLGTRGYIDARSPRHRMHSSLAVAYRDREVVVDFGEDWQGKADAVRPRAIVLTHAHPDHARGLADGAPCPVWATWAAWEVIDGYPVHDRHIVAPREPFEILGITFEAFPVEHSLRAPAVGYRITAGQVTAFYAPDLASIHGREEALRGCRIYIGDGSTLTRPLVRRREDRLIGHAPVRAQLGWCAAEGVPRALFTHCGSGIVEGDEAAVASRVREMAAERGVEAAVAYDGMELVVR